MRVRKPSAASDALQSPRGVRGVAKRPGYGRNVTASGGSRNYQRYAWTGGCAEPGWTVELDHATPLAPVDSPSPRFLPFMGCGSWYIRKPDR